MKALFDTNILIDYLNGETKAKDTIEKFSENYISIITYIEVMVGITAPEHVVTVQKFLLHFNLLHFDLKIAERAVLIRQKHRIKIPDAVILASAEEQGCLLITRNTKDFPSSLPIVHVPY